MRRFYLKKLKTVFLLNLMNFDNEHCCDFLSPVDRHKKWDLEILLFKDQHKGRGARPGSLYREIFNTAERRTFCFFKSGISLGHVITREVNQSFLVFQGVLDILFLHAASVIIGDKVYLFVAPSKGGKTTVASLALESGLRVMGDESCIIKRKKNRFYAGTFPFNDLSDTLDKEREIGGIFLLNKSGVNKAKDLPATEALRRAMPEATCFFHKHVPESEKVNHKKHVFNFLNSMFENVDYKLLDFKNKSDIFSYLKCHVQKDI